ncbi:MAG: dockerin type I domain-containing protein [Planctomycetota bacterium]
MIKRCILIVAVIVFAGGVRSSLGAAGEGGYHVDSFFDVFTELSVGTGQTLGVNLQGKRLDSTDPLNVAALHVTPQGPGGVTLIGELPDPATPPHTVHMFLKCPPEPSIESFFDVFIDVEPPAGAAGAPPALAAPPRIDPDPAMVESFFDVFVEIEIPDAPPDQKILHLQMHCMAAQEGVGLVDVHIGDDGVNMADSFFDVFVEIEIGGQHDDKLYNPELPAVVLDLSGRFRPSLDSLPGDADLDGEVDLDDFVILKNHFGQGNAAWTQGDFNTDGLVNLDDFVILKNNFGRPR